MGERSDNCVRDNNLRFSQDETNQFYHRATDLKLPAEELKLMSWRTEVWRAGLQMATLALRGKEDLTAAPADFGARCGFTNILSK